MKIKSLLAGAAAAALVVSPIQAHAGMTAATAQAGETIDDDDDGLALQIGIGFFLIVIVLLIFVGSDDSSEGRTSP